jgi:hypothetical protein
MWHKLAAGALRHMAAGVMAEEPERLEALGIVLRALRSDVDSGCIFYYSTVE